MVCAVIRNKAGDEEEFRKPCFGFMNYIDQWDEDDEVWDEDQDEWVSGPLSKFNSDDITHLMFHPEWGDHFGYSDDEDEEEVKVALREAMGCFPQFYDNVTVNDDFSVVTFPLENVEMQKTIFGGMMLRNIIQYSGASNAFLFFLDKGIAPKLAFVMAQRYYQSYNMTHGNVYYRAGGDETIFSNNCTLEDIKHLMDGNAPRFYQGVWGTTDNGYDRGERGCTDVRTGRNASMVTTMHCASKEEAKSPLLDFEKQFNDLGNTYSFSVSSKRMADLAEAMKTYFE